MIATSVKASSRCARLFSAASPGSTAGPDRPRRGGYRIARSDVHAQLITQARDEALGIIKDNPKLDGERGQALRCLLHLFERDEAMPLIGAG
jgi:ATP-dependent DNA helicase RecG